MTVKFLQTADDSESFLNIETPDVLIHKRLETEGNWLMSGQYWKPGVGLFKRILRQSDQWCRARKQWPLLQGYWARASTIAKLTIRNGEYWYGIFYRPGVAGAVLHTALLFIHSVSQSAFSSKSSKYHKSQTVRAKELKFLENVHPPQHVTCQMAHVKCHVIFLFFLFGKVVKLIGGGLLSMGPTPSIFCFTLYIRAHNQLGFH